MLVFVVRCAMRVSGKLCLRFLYTHKGWFSVGRGRFKVCWLYFPSNPYLPAVALRGVVPVVAAIKPKYDERLSVVRVVLVPQKHLANLALSDAAPLFSFLQQTNARGAALQPARGTMTTRASRRELP